MQMTRTNEVKKSNQARAAELAVRCLAFIAEDPDRLGSFLALSGVGPSEIRAQAQDPAFLGGILDYLLSDEAMLLAFADWADVDASVVADARQHLPGAIEI